MSAGWSAISASRRGPALRPKPASNRTLVIRRRQVEAYPNLMSDAMCKLRQDRIEF
uniref:Tn21 TnpM n=1 Tax=Escherichia coli TaxID=562 RepID=A0A3G2YR01_ECOLX|nr:Tn21 TnpM [Escherichia coli]